MERTIDLGKIDFVGCGRRVNRVEVELELEKKGKKEVFTASATVFNEDGTGFVLYGQCIDTLAPFLKRNHTYWEIARLWLLYHLNDSRVGTERQEECLNHLYGETGGDVSDEEIRDYLKERGLLFDHGHEYGKTLLYRPIPAEDREIIVGLIEGRVA